MAREHSAAPSAVGACSQTQHSAFFAAAAKSVVFCVSPTALEVSSMRLASMSMWHYDYAPIDKLINAMWKAHNSCCGYATPSMIRSTALLSSQPLTCQASTSVGGASPSSHPSAPSDRPALCPHERPQDREHNDATLHEEETLLPTVVAE